MYGFANFRVDAVLDPITQELTAWHIRLGYLQLERTIWLDRRPHPGELARHTWA